MRKQRTTYINEILTFPKEYLNKIVKKYFKKFPLFFDRDKTLTKVGQSSRFYDITNVTFYHLTVDNVLSILRTFELLLRKQFFFSCVIHSPQMKQWEK